MKYMTFCLAILFFAVAGCKKADDITPSATANPIGVYDISTIITFKVGTYLATESTMGTLTVTAANKPNTLHFEEQYPTGYNGYNSSYSVTVNGNDFQLEPLTDKIPSDGILYSGQQLGYGSFQSYGLSIHKSVNTAETGKTANRVLQKNTEMTAYKK